MLVVLLTFFVLVILKSRKDAKAGGFANKN